MDVNMNGQRGTERNSTSETETANSDHTNEASATTSSAAQFVRQQATEDDADIEIVYENITRPGGGAYPESVDTIADRYRRGDNYQHVTNYESNTVITGPYQSVTNYGSNTLILGQHDTVKNFGTNVLIAGSNATVINHSNHVVILGASQHSTNFRSIPQRGLSEAAEERVPSTSNLSFSASYDHAGALSQSLHTGAGALSQYSGSRGLVDQSCIENPCGPHCPHARRCYNYYESQHHPSYQPQENYAYYEQGPENLPDQEMEHYRDGQNQEAAEDVYQCYNGFDGHHSHPPYN